MNSKRYCDIIIFIFFYGNCINRTIKINKFNCAIIQNPPRSCSIISFKPICIIFSYVKALAQNFFGITRIHRYTAEGLDIVGTDVEQVMRQAKAAITAETAEHTIPYPEKYGNCPTLDGASSFGGTADHLQSRYYVANDYFHMKSDATLHILHQFQTYQQTTEYTCGAASALMVLNWFGQKQYHEKAIAGLLETHATKGSSVESIADLFDLVKTLFEF